MADHPSQLSDTMTNQKQAEGHTYTVQLRFAGPQLDPSEITARLDLIPSHTSDQMRSHSAIKRGRAFWAYNGQGEIGFQSEWHRLEDGLEFLLKNLAPKKFEIIAVARQFDAIWWCGHFQASFDGGPTLSPEMLTELGTYGIPLSIDNYFSDE